MSTAFQHSTIGRLIPKTSDADIVQFLGLQYATLKDRFAPAVLKDYGQNEEIDASKIGPVVPTSPGGPKNEMRFLQQSLEYDETQYHFSDTDCLNLNITVPASVLEGSKKLPVLVFIHGGAFLHGSGSNPIYDFRRLIRLSQSQGLPILGVSINYRLGAPGFLTSHELREAGYLPNNTFRDQRTALMWIQKHISGFGGNPDEITLVGESAGGVSANYHLHSSQPLFKRVVCMSGTTLLVPPTSLETAELIYERALKALDLESLPPAKRIETLNKMDIQDLRNKLLMAGIPASPVIDGEIVPSAIDYSAVEKNVLKVPGRDWCSAMIMGDCEFDGAIQGMRMPYRDGGLGTAFCKHVNQFFSDQPEIGNLLLEKYQLSPSMTQEAALNNVLEFCTDLCWYAPSVEIAESLADSMPIYMYRFNQANPWPGPNKGRAIHIFDLVALLQNFNDFMDDESRQLNERFAGQIFNFVHGNEPWRIYKMNAVDDGRAANVLGPDGQISTRVDLASLVGRRGQVFTLARKIGFDRLRRCWDDFLSNP